ncbi:MAG: hypothetical protein ACREFD_11765 [Stellaceae bacterium]
MIPAHRPVTVDELRAGDRAIDMFWGNDRLDDALLFASERSASSPVAATIKS